MVPQPPFGATPANLSCSHPKQIRAQPSGIRSVQLLDLSRFLQEGTCSLNITALPEIIKGAELNSLWSGVRKRWKQGNPSRALANCRSRTCWRSGNAAELFTWVRISKQMTENLLLGQRPCELRALWWSGSSVLRAQACHLLGESCREERGVPGQGSAGLADPTH